MEGEKSGGGGGGGGGTPNIRSSVRSVAWVAQGRAGGQSDRRLVWPAGGLMRGRLPSVGSARGRPEAFKGGHHTTGCPPPKRRRDAALLWEAEDKGSGAIHLNHLLNRDQHQLQAAFKTT